MLRNGLLATAAVTAGLLTGAWADPAPEVPHDSGATLKLRDGAPPSAVERVPPPPSVPGIPDRPARWTREPSNEEFSKLYPERAARLEIEGRAVLTCIIGLDEVLRDCSILSEAPAGYGFGNAALTMAQRSRMAPPVIGGQRRETRVRIPFGFNLAEPAPPRPVERSSAAKAREEAQRFDDATFVPPPPPLATPKRPVKPVDLSWVKPYLGAAAGGALAFALLLAMTMLVLDRRERRRA